MCCHMVPEFQLALQELQINPADQKIIPGGGELSANKRIEIQFKRGLDMTRGKGEHKLYQGTRADLGSSKAVLRSMLSWTDEFIILNKIYQFLR